jgi:hypothetical protein
MDGAGIHLRSKNNDARHKATHRSSGEHLWHFHIQKQGTVSAFSTYTWHFNTQPIFPYLFRQLQLYEREVRPLFLYSDLHKLSIDTIFIMDLTGKLLTIYI